MSSSIISAVSILLGWVKCAWSPYTEKEFQKIMERKLQNDEVGLKFSLRTGDKMSDLDQMESYLQSLNLFKGDNSDISPSCHNFSQNSAVLGNTENWCYKKEGTINVKDSNETSKGHHDRKYSFDQCSPGCEDDCHVHTLWNAEDMTGDLRTFECRLHRKDFNKPVFLKETIEMMQDNSNQDHTDCTVNFQLLNENNSADGNGRDKHDKEALKTVKSHESHPDNDLSTVYEDESESCQSSENEPIECDLQDKISSKVLTENQQENSDNVQASDTSNFSIASNNVQHTNASGTNQSEMDEVKMVAKLESRNVDDVELIVKSEKLETESNEIDGNNTIESSETDDVNSKHGKSLMSSNTVFAGLEGESPLGLELETFQQSLSSEDRETHQRSKSFPYNIFQKHGFSFLKQNHRELTSKSLSDKQKTGSKSVTWKVGRKHSFDGSNSDNADEAFEESENNLFYGRLFTEEDQQSSDEELTENDLAYGQEGFSQYKLYVEIEKRVQIEDINEERERLRNLIEQRVTTIGNIITAARAYYMDPTDRTIEEWKKLKRELGLDKTDKSHTHIKLEMAKLADFWPLFTILISLVQVIACCVIFAMLGVTDIGIEPFVESKENVKTFLGIETIHKWVQPNLWIGPSQSNLISIGAFFPPCLREDIEIQLLALESNFSRTETLGCCEISIRNTAGTTTKEECQDLTHGAGTWKDGERCSQRMPGENSVVHNMRPCCYSLLGQCKLTTHEHCVFIGGHFFTTGVEHCSQVNCLSSLCGMGGLSSKLDQPWLPSSPNQWWRLLLSMIYHHGVIHILILSLLQFLMMRTMEKSIGWLRMGLAYILCGFGGILAASVFEPHFAHVGAAGSVAGLLGVTLVEILLLWRFINRPYLELIKVSLVIVLFLLLGTLQYVSIYMVIFGLMIGVCSAVIVLPYVTFSKISRRLRNGLVAVCVPVLLVIYFLLFFMLFKVQSVADCFVCDLVNCVPYTENMCRKSYD